MARSAVSDSVELHTALVFLRKENPALGVAKLHALLLEAHPTWSVSEKRVRKILQNEHGQVRAPDSGTPSHPSIATRPASCLNKSLDIARWCSKIKVHYFDPVKGKGLVATEKISEGEVLWREDPFVLAPEWDIYDLQRSSRACAFCSTPLANHSPAHVRLPCSASQAVTAPPCPAVFCNRLCRTRSENVHPLLCPARNPASIALLKFARDAEWMALHALAQCTSRLLLSAQRDDGTSDQVVQSLAELGMEERFQALRDKGVEPDRETWKRAHELYVCAFKSPKTSDEQKRLARILKRPVPESSQRVLFEYDAFLRGLGRMSLNLEAHGGLYELHSHLNHACAPNTSVRHFDRRTALARITVVAKAAIDPGDELLITYVDPASDYKERQKRLLEWGFGPCRCERCLREEGEARASSGAGAGAELEADELADELRAGLGLV